MMGITEYTVADIFDYIHRVIKVSNQNCFCFPFVFLIPTYV